MAGAMSVEVKVSCRGAEEQWSSGGGMYSAASERLGGSNFMKSARWAAPAGSSERTSCPSGFLRQPTVGCAHL